MRTHETQRLDNIATQWTQVQMAILGQGPAATQAKAELFQRYGGAIRRYLQAALGQPAAVDDLTQEFAVALVSGGFRHVQPERGRFRDYVKGVLFRLVHKHRRQNSRQPGPLSMRLLPQFAEFQARRFGERYAPAWRRLVGAG